MSIVFGFNQLAPDLIDAVANMNVDMGADSKKGYIQKKKLQAKFVANWAKSMKFLASPYNYKSGLDMELTNTDPNTMTMKEFWLEAQLNGMPLSWRKVNYSFEDGYKELDKIASESDKLPVKATMKNLAKGYVNTISNLNDAMENVNRLTAYITARKEGLSPQRAAQMGKEITINFERKGVKDDMMRLMYLFWGAAVNGAKRSGKTMKALGRKGAGAVIMGAVINRMLMYAFMDEDEREGFIQSEYNNRNRVIIPIPGTGKHINVKSPYSFMRIYYAMGKGIVDVAYNQRTLADVVTDMLDGFMTAFSPIAGNASFTNFAPTLTQPLVQVLANSDYKGDPIISKAQELFRYRNIDKYKESTEDREGTDELFVQLAERIYELTGFDWSPAYMEYLFDGYIYKPALRETLTPIDNIPNMFGGHKISDSVAEALGFDMTNREFDFWGGDANNVIPPLKAFYRPNDVELQSLWNFYSFTDRPLWKGLTDEQFMYIASAYKTILKNDLADPRAVESVISKLKDKYPDKKWSKVDMIKEMYK